MNLYVTTDEIKTYLGIGVSTKDGLIAMLNKQATSVINGIVDSADLSLHKVTDEIHDAVGQVINLNEKKIVEIGRILSGDTEYVQNAEYDILSNRVKLESYLTAGPRKAKVTYAAGYNASGTSKIVVTDYQGIAADATIELGAKNSDGYTLTRGTDWTAGTSNETEAENIAKAIDAKAGTRAFACGSTVYVIEATNPQVAGRTIATSDSVRLTLSAESLGDINFPEEIRMAIMMYVGSLMTMGKNPKVKSYSIGTKSVTFATDSEFNQFNSLLKPYRKVGVSAI